MYIQNFTQQWVEFLAKDTEDSKKKQIRWPSMEIEYERSLGSFQLDKPYQGQEIP